METQCTFHVEEKNQGTKKTEVCLTHGDIPWKFRFFPWKKTRYQYCYWKRIVQLIAHNGNSRCSPRGFLLTNLVLSLQISFIFINAVGICSWNTPDCVFFVKKRRKNWTTLWNACKMLDQITPGRVWTEKLARKEEKNEEKLNNFVKCMQDAGSNYTRPRVNRKISQKRRKKQEKFIINNVCA